MLIKSIEEKTGTSDKGEYIRIIVYVNELQSPLIAFKNEINSKLKIGDKVSLKITEKQFAEKVYYDFVVDDTNFIKLVDLEKRLEKIENSFKTFIKDLDKRFEQLKSDLTIDLTGGIISPTELKKFTDSADELLNSK